MNTQVAQSHRYRTQIDVGVQGQVSEVSLQLKAKIAGVLYLIIFLGGLFAVGYLPATLFVSGDAVATMQNILNNESLYRLGLAVHIVIALCNIPLAVLFYDLFKVTNKSLARAVSLFILIAVAIESVTLLNKFVPLIVLHGEPYINVITIDQLQAHAYLPLQFQEFGFLLSLIFVGCYCLLAGYLIFRFRFLPRLAGLLLTIGGACYLINGFANVVSPEFAASLFPYILLPSAIGEGSLTLSLLFSKFDARGSANAD